MGNSKIYKKGFRMVSKKLNKSIEEIQKSIDSENKVNFVLNGGAGSGKTTSLLKTVDYIYKKNPNANVVCITFTNVAVDEIKKRCLYNNLRVSTIHEFAWSTIKMYQKNLKEILLEKIISKDIKYNGEQDFHELFLDNKEIQYRDYKKLEEGIISHDEVLILFKSMYKQYAKIRKIFSDTYDYLLLDEYQDTNKDIVDIFLKDLEGSKTRFYFFGDPMQSIYSDNNAIGNVIKYINSGKIKEIKKEDNYRCSKKVISFINNLRDDDIKQEPAGNNLEGTVTFLYSTNDIKIDEIKQNEVFDGWKWDNYQETKELYLTHRLISKEAGFNKLFNLYNNNAKYNKIKEYLINKPENKDKLAKVLHQISFLCFCYENKNYHELIKALDKVDKNLSIIGYKKKIKSIIESLNNKSIAEAIDCVDKELLPIKDDNFQSYIEENQDFYNEISKIPLQEAINLYQYENNYLPYSTQHGIKGAEFNNVFIVMDNGNWSKYNFEKLFKKKIENKDVYERTKKLFYVCCSRAKDNLVIYMNNPSEEVIKHFKDNNVDVITM